MPDGLMHPNHPTPSGPRDPVESDKESAPRLTAKEKGKQTAAADASMSENEHYSDAGRAHGGSVTPIQGDTAGVIFLSS